MSRPNNTRREQTRTRLQLEQLEERLQPANLSVTNAYLCNSAGEKIETAAVGTLVYLKADFKASNLAANAKYVLKFSIDGDARSSDPITWGAGTSGASNWGAVLGYWIVKSGSHTAKVQLDSTNKVSESSDSDNVKSFSFTPTTFKSGYNSEAKFITPAAGTPNVHWKIQNYVDLDPGDGRLDYFGRTGDAARNYNSHNGLDMSANGFGTQDVGLPIYAAASGVVTEVADGHFDENTEACKDACDGGYWGNFVTIDHGNGWETNYIHLRENSTTVEKGDWVNVGDTLGLMASSGNSTGTHLHFRVAHNGRLVEPYVAPNSYWVSPLPYSGNPPYDNPTLQTYDKYHATEGDGTARVPVYKLSGSSVNYTTQTVSAVAGLDYSSQSGTVTFSGNETVKYVNVPLTDDGLHEGAEKFKVNFTDTSTNATWSQEWTIVDNDLLLNYDTSTDTLTIEGHTGSINDVITLDTTATAVKVTVNNETASFPLSGPLGPVTKVVVNAGDGNDTIHVLATPSNVKTTVNGGNGTDLINVGRSGELFDAAYSMNGIKGELTVNGGSGNNTLNLRDNDVSGASQIYVITDSAVTRTGGIAVLYDLVQELNLTASDGADTFTVNSTDGNSPLAIDGGGGSDTIQGPNADDLWNITAANKGTLDFSRAYFTNVENLIGRSGVDTFKFGPNGSLSGNVTGGVATDVLDYSGYGKQVVVNFATGKATGIGGTISLVDKVIGSALTTDQVVGVDSLNTWDITANNAFTLNGIYHGESIENLKGGTGKDTFKFGNGKTISGSVDGQGNSDTLNFAAYSTSVSFNLVTKVITGVGSYASIENVVGGTASDTLWGVGTTSGINTWNLTGPNAGIFVGSATVNFSGVENLKGHSNTDSFTFVNGASVSGQIDGQGGSDKLDYAAHVTPVNIDLAQKTATGTGGIVSVEVFVGGTAVDTLVGANSANTWKITSNNAGNLNGGQFTSFENLTGGSSSDKFVFSDAATISGMMKGGAGTDTLDYAAYLTSITADLSLGKSTGVTGGISAIENVFGGAAGDKLTGDGLTNLLRGNGGVDTLVGGLGDDILVGGALGDTMSGGEGRDLLFGGTGADKLSGEIGDDLLIGGTTAHDESDVSLTAILDEWQRTDRTYEQRIDTLRKTGAGRGLAKLNSTTVLDDAAKDTLLGGSDSDWFWAFGTKLTLDTTDVGHEQVN